MTAEIIMAIALLCQVNGTYASGRKFYRDAQEKCQASYLKCMKTTGKSDAAKSLAQCIEEKSKDE